MAIVNIGGIDVDTLDIFENKGNVGKILLNEDWTVAWSNQPARDMFGYADLAGKPLNELASVEGHINHMNPDQRLEGGTPNNLTRFHGIDVQGIRFPILIARADNVFPIPGGNPGDVVNVRSAVVIDVRKHLTDSDERIATILDKLTASPPPPGNWENNDTWTTFLTREANGDSDTAIRRDSTFTESRLLVFLRELKDAIDNA